jgi:prepilin-type processing-associated H-X9-DG protein
LLELLVVIAIIATLLGLLMPAVQKVRATADPGKCQNHLKQLGLAIMNYESAQGVLPMLADYSASGHNETWSMPTRLLEYLEQGSIGRLVDLSMPFSEQPQVAATRVSVFICPSDINSREWVDDGLVYVPMNYAANAGVWAIYQRPIGVGDGAFIINRALRYVEITDGLCHTIGMAEVKTSTPDVRDGGSPSTLVAPAPDSPEAIGMYCTVGTLRPDSGHNEWVDANVHHSGFTATFPPNTVVPWDVNGRTIDVDFTSWRENRSPARPTYAAITSRSYHRSGVNVVMLDGSVCCVSNTIPLSVWRAGATRAGNEPIASE